MLLKLTCPSCGRTDQASDRVVGKEVRCQCGAIFRVLGPKRSAQAEFNPLLSQPGLDSSRHALQPRQSDSRPKSLSPSHGPDNHPTRPPDSYSTRSPLEQRKQKAPVPNLDKQPATSGLPPWAYAAFGGGAVLFVVVMGGLAVLLSSSSKPTPQKVAQTEPTLAVRTASETDPSDEKPQAVVAPSVKSSDSQSVITSASGATTEPAAPIPKSTGAPLTTAQIVARREPSVALVKGKASVGTGFVVRHGVLATNAHVIEDEFTSNLEVRFPSAPAGIQGPYQARLLYEDRKRDIAFLALKCELPVLPLAPNYSFVKGEDVIVIGNPGMGDETVLENAISRGVMSAKTVIDGMPFHQMNIAINPGNSGGPVFDPLGRVIGIATLKSSKTEAMGFCIPVEDVNAALAKVGRARPEVDSHHRAIVALRLLTIGGALYSIALEVRAGVLQSAPNVANVNLVPDEDIQKLHEAVTSLDEKLISLVDGQLPALRGDPVLSQASQQRYQELANNYQAMKRLYINPNRFVDQYFGQIQNVKAQHLRLIQSFQRELNVEVPDKLLAVLQPRSIGGQPPTMVADFVPPQLQPRFRRMPGMIGPRGPLGPRAGIQDPLQAARDQRRQMQDRMRKQMQNMRKRAQGQFGN